MPTNGRPTNLFCTQRKLIQIFSQPFRENNHSEDPAIPVNVEHAVMELLFYWTYFPFDTYESRLHSGPHLPPEGETVFPRAHASPALSHGPLQAGGHRQDRDSRYEQTADAWWLSGDLVVVTPAVTRSKSFACRWSAMRGTWIYAPSWSTRERNLVTSRVGKDQGSAEALWSPIVKTG